MIISNNSIYGIDYFWIENILIYKNLRKISSIIWEEGKDQNLENLKSESQSTNQAYFEKFLYIIRL